MARSNGRSSNSTSNRTQTKPNQQGIGVIAQLSEGVDKTYLCTHICIAKNTTRVDALGRHLKQRACTATIWIDEDLHLGLWRYKAEVGYLMNRKPPMPLMSSKPNEWLRPSRFPLAAAIREIEEGERIKGNLRIPDCIILKISDQQTASLAKRLAEGRGSQADLGHFIPVQDNIDTVVEIKFEGDSLSKEQKEAYEKIAGSNKFRELKEVDCACGVRRIDPRTQPYEQYIRTIKLRPDFNSLFLTPRYSRVQNSYTKDVSLSQFVDKPTIAQIAFGAAVVTVAIVVAIGGTAATGLVVLTVSLAAQS